MIKPGKTVLLAVLSFLTLGVPRIITSASATAMFIQSFGAGMLPWTYIAAALLAIFINGFYLWLQPRISFWILQSSAVFFSALILSAAWAGTGTEFRSYFVFLAMVWVEIEWMLADQVFWGLSSRMYSIRESKTELSRAAAGEPAAIILTGLSVPVILQFVTTENLILGSVFSALTALLVIWFIYRYHRQDLRTDNGLLPGEKKSGIPRFGKHKLLIILFFVSVVFSQISYLITDTVFFSLAESHYTSESDMASFWSLFMAAAGITHLLFSTFVSPHLIRITGIAASLLLLPGITAVISAAAALFLFQDSLVWTFALLAAVKLGDESVRTGLTQPAVISVLQVLPPGLRTRVQAMGTGYVQQISSAAGGTLILLLTGALQSAVYANLYFSILIPASVAVLVLWLLSLRKLSDFYIKSLSDAFRKRKVSNDIIFQNPELTQKLALRSLQSDKAQEVIYSLSLIKKISHGPELRESVRLLLSHPDPDVRNAACTAAAEAEIHELTQEIKARLEEETSLKAKPGLMKAAAVILKEDSIEILLKETQSRSQEIRAAAYSGLMMHCGIEGMLACGDRFLTLHRSKMPKKRMLAAQVLHEIASPRIARLLVHNLETGDSEIRRMALRTMAKSASPEFWPVMLEAVKSVRDGGVAASCLSGAGESILPDIFRIYRNEEKNYIKYRLIRLAGRIGGVNAGQWLLGHAVTGDPELKWRTAKALDQSGYRCPPDTAQQVWEAAADAADCALRIDSLIPPENTILLHSLRNRMVYAEKMQIRRIFWLLSSVLPRENLKLAMRKLEYGSDDEKTYALELFDSLLPVRSRNLFIKAAESFVSGARSGTESSGIPEEQLLQEIILNQDNHFSSLLRSAALLALVRKPPRAERSRFRPLLVQIAETADEDRLLRETAESLINEIKPKKKGVKPRMLTIEKMILLSSIPTFSDLPDSLLGEIAESLKETEFSEGDWIMKEGETGDCLYIIAEGAVSVISGGITVSTMKEGDVVGELAALDPEIRTASVKAETDVTALILEHSDLEEMMAGSAELAQGFLKMITRRLRENNLVLHEAARSGLISG